MRGQAPGNKITFMPDNSNNENKAVDRPSLGDVTADAPLTTNGGDTAPELELTEEDSRPLRGIDYVFRVIRHESFAGLLLILAATAALLMANDPVLSHYYEGFLHLKAMVQIGDVRIEKHLLHWINDGLMAIFFLQVGLELKREFYVGELKSREQVILPALAALGGMAVPAVIYALVNIAHPENLRGWAIPTATDIAFALGILSLLGKRVPLALKTFLLALAMFDDLGAIIVIALFYTESLNATALTWAGALLAILVFFNVVLRIRAIGPYLIVGLFMWASVLESGVHATLAGFLLALTIPYVTPKQRGTLETHHMHDNPALALEHMLVPYVTLLIMPLFAFANAGVTLSGNIAELFTAPITLGIALGLFIGKQVGVFGTIWLGTRTGLMRLPHGIHLPSIWGVSLLAGIGFTMSLFIGSLSFDDLARQNAVRLGVLTGTLFSAVAGFVVLLFALRHNSVKSPPETTTESVDSRSTGR